MIFVRLNVGSGVDRPASGYSTLNVIETLSSGLHPLKMKFLNDIKCWHNLSLEINKSRNPHASRYIYNHIYF